MAVKALHARLVLVVPDLDESVVGPGHEVGLVAAVVVIDAVDALLVAVQRKIGRLRAELPDFNGAVEGGRSEGVGVLGVDDDLHDVVGVALENLLTGPILVPVPQLDAHVVGGRQSERPLRMNGDAADVVGMRLEHVDAFERVVVEDADGHVVGAGDDPVFARHELGRSHGDVADFEGLDERLTLVVPDVDVAVVEAREHPRLGRVKVAAFHAVRTRRQTAFDVQAERLKWKP